MCIYIYIYIERERDIHIYIYIYIKYGKWPQASVVLDSRKPRLTPQGSQAGCSTVRLSAGMFSPVFVHSVSYNVLRL